MARASRSTGRLLQGSLGIVTPIQHRVATLALVEDAFSCDGNVSREIRDNSDTHPIVGRGDNAIFVACGGSRLGEVAGEQQSPYSARRKLSGSVLSTHVKPRRLHGS